MILPNVEAYVTSLKAPKKIPVSCYYSFKNCMYKALMENNNLKFLLPNSPKKYFGIAAHTFLEEINKGKVSHNQDFESTWYSIINEIEKELIRSDLERHLVPLNQAISLYDLNKKLLFKRANDLLKEKKLYNSKGHIDKGYSSSGVEKNYENSYTIGRIDKVIYDAKGIMVIDYKTGTILEKHSQTIKEEYQYQMLLYAALIFEKEGVWPYRLTIVGLNGEEHDILVDIGIISTLLKNVQLILKISNKLLNSNKSITDVQESLANPSSICKLCNYRPVCVPYWKGKDINFISNKICDIRGRYVEHIQLGNGKYLLILNSGEKKVLIRGLNKIEKSINKHNGYIFLYNIFSEGQNDQYLATNQTVLYYK